MDKRDLVDQLTDQLRQSARTARAAGSDAAREAASGVTPAERRESARAAMEYGNMAKAQSRRAKKMLAELRVLEGFRPPPLAERARISIGAIVEVEDDDTGEGRTFFLAPVGAGATVTGPGGDGLLSVVTPGSPIGKAVMGRRRGDDFDVTIRGEPRAFTITYVC